MIYPSEELASAAGRVAENADVMEVIFEHCGLPRLDTLQRVCRSWYALARDMPARWATACIAGHLRAYSNDESDSDEEPDEVDAQFAVRLPVGGGLAVADSGNDRILFYSPSDLDAHTAGITMAAPTFRSIGRPGAAPGNLNYPLGLATDGTHLFVADSHNHRVQQLRISDGRSMDSIGEEGSGHGQLYYPESLALVRGSHGESSGALPGDSGFAVGNGDRLCVADTGNHRICVFGVSPLTSFGQRGSAPFELLTTLGASQCMKAACTSPTVSPSGSRSSRSPVRSCAPSTSTTTSTASRCVRMASSSSVMGKATTWSCGRSSAPYCRCAWHRHASTSCLAAIYI